MMKRFTRSFLVALVFLSLSARPSGLTGAEEQFVAFVTHTLKQVVEHGDEFDHGSHTRIENYYHVEDFVKDLEGLLEPVFQDTQPIERRHVRSFKRICGCMLDSMWEKAESLEGILLEAIEDADLLEDQIPLDSFSDRARDRYYRATEYVADNAVAFKVGGAVTGMVLLTGAGIGTAVYVSKRGLNSKNNDGEKKNLENRNDKKNNFGIAPVNMNGYDTPRGVVDVNIDELDFGFGTQAEIDVRKLEEAKVRKIKEEQTAKAREIAAAIMSPSPTKPKNPSPLAMLGIRPLPLPPKKNVVKNNSNKDQLFSPNADIVVEDDDETDSEGESPSKEMEDAQALWAKHLLPTSQEEANSSSPHILSVQPQHLSESPILNGNGPAAAITPSAFSQGASKLKKVTDAQKSSGSTKNTVARGSEVMNILHQVVSKRADSPQIKEKKESYEASEQIEDEVEEELKKKEWAEIPSGLSMSEMYGSPF